MTRTSVPWQVGLIALATTAAIAAAGCGGSSGDGTGVGTNSIAVSGIVTPEGNGGMASSDPNRREAFRIRATASSGSVHETEADDRGRFTMMLPPNDSYVIGFEHRDMASGEMHFAGYMVFDCGAGQSDHFFLSGRERAIDLGTVVVRRDGSFARSGRNPMDQMDRDRDGTPDSRDPNTQCEDAGDRNHDGFYDDDMNHDGHHDDDMDGDGHHDCEMDGMMGHDGEDDDCRGPGMTRTPDGTPAMTRTPEPTARMTPTAEPTAAQPTPTADEHGH